MTVRIEGLEYLELGSRFQLTRLGAERCSRFVGQTGIIVGFSRANGSIRVLFDGTKTARSLHRTYIEPVLAEARTPEEMASFKARLLTQRECPCVAADPATRRG